MSSSDEQISKAFYELSAILLSILRSPPGSGPPPRRIQAVPRSPSARRSKMTPAAFASLLLGVSFAMMLSGSVTFVIGIMLMPWVLGFVMVLYFVGIVSSLSAMLCPSSWVAGSRTSPKEIHGTLIFLHDGCQTFKFLFTLPPFLTLKNFEGLDLGKMDKADDSGLASYVAGQIDRSLSWKEAIQCFTLMFFAIQCFRRQFSVSGGNAGIMATPYLLLHDGIELQFATNHIGHFLLTNLLLENMKDTSRKSNTEEGLSFFHQRATE
ncbi:uncharacterized protein A4U43_C06F12540 [Asparagus officinalis]|uniref:Uncharacterized protein n=1 Tax=Asparagus officinalis TaxID=4686 RepID=A0A5P1ENW2_ASPOF|nr:uncharacterized protein A4U43_C06F12540 [Asparagus officinalis]